jgi:hypothetical protein
MILWFIKIVVFNTKLRLSRGENMLASQSGTQKQFTVNLDEYPRPLHTPQKGETLVLGALNGNTLNLIHFLMEMGVLTLTPTQFDQLKQICDRQYVIDTEENKQVSKQQFEESIELFENILSQAKFNNTATIRLTGNVLSDRGITNHPKNDFLTLKVIEAMRTHGVRTEIIFSKHDRFFIHAEKDNNFSQKDSLENGAGASFDTLFDLIQAGIIDKENVHQLAKEHYYPSLKLLSYGIEDKGIGKPTINIYTHAPVSLFTIEAAAIDLGVKYKADSAEALGKTIDRMNEAFNELLSDPKKLKEKVPLFGDQENHHSPAIFPLLILICNQYGKNWYSSELKDTATLLPDTPTNPVRYVYDDYYHNRTFAQQNLEPNKSNSFDVRYVYGKGDIPPEEDQKKFIVDLNSDLGYSANGQRRIFMPTEYQLPHNLEWWRWRNIQKTFAGERAPSDKKINQETFERELAKFKLDPSQTSIVLFDPVAKKYFTYERHQTTLIGAIPAVDTQKGKQECVIHVFSKQEYNPKSSPTEDAAAKENTFFNKVKKTIGLGLEPKVYDSFLITGVSSTELKNLISYGALDTSHSPLTTRVISELGKYHAKQLQHATKKGIISDRYEVKKAMMDFYQKRIELLQPLERLINASNPDLNAIKDEIKRALTAYIIALRQELVNLQNLQNHLSKYDEKASETIQKSIEAQISEAKNLEDKVATLDEATNFLSPIGTGTLYTFIRNEIRHTLQEAEKININITYTRRGKGTHAWARGDFHSSCIEAEYAIDRFEVDLHNRYKAKEQGIIGENEQVTLDSSSFNSHNSLKQTIDCIEAATGKLEISPTQSAANPLIKFCLLDTSTTKSQFLTTQRSTKWSSAPLKFPPAEIDPATGNKRTRTLKEIAIGLASVFSLFEIWNFAVAPIVGMVIDIIPGFIQGLRDKPYKPFTQRLHIDIEKIGNPAEPESIIPSNVELPYSTSSGGLIATGLRKLITETWGVLKSLGDAGKNFVFTTPSLIVQDFQKPATEEERQTRLNAIQKKCDDIQAEFDLRKQKFENKVHLKTGQPVDVVPVITQAAQPTVMRQHNPDEVTLDANRPHRVEESPESEITDQASAVPLNITAPFDFQHKGGYELTGIVNAAANGFEEFSDLFGKNICAKHPLAGLLFVSLYATGFAAAVLPAQIVHALTGVVAKYVAISNTLGHGIAGGDIGMGISSGFTQGKLICALYEAMRNGPESWLATGVSDFEKEPAKAVIYLCAATMLGYYMAHPPAIDIPGMHLPGFDTLDIHFKGLNIPHHHLQAPPIPYLTPHLVEDYGTFWPAAASFAGLKISILLYELLASHKHLSQKLNLDDFKNTLLEKLNVKEMDPAKQKAVSKKVDELFSSEEAVEKMAALVSSRQPPDVLPEGITNVGAEIVEAFVPQLSLISFLNRNQEVLPYLPTKEREQVKREIEHCFGHGTKEAQAMKEFIKPPKNTSLLGDTITRAFDYVPAGLRTLINCVNPQVWRGEKNHAWHDLKEKTTKDIADLATGTTKIVKTVCGIVYLGLNLVAQLLKLPSVRVENGFFGTHYILHGCSALSRGVFKFYDTKVRPDGGWLADTLAKKASAPTPETAAENVAEGVKKIGTTAGLLKRLLIDEPASVTPPTPSIPYSTGKGPISQPPPGSNGLTTLALEAAPALPLNVGPQL